MDVYKIFSKRLIILLCGSLCKSVVFDGSLLSMISFILLRRQVYTSLEVWWVDDEEC
jgi:hypothetical protein